MGDENWTVYDVCKPFEQRECFFSRILLLNMLNPNKGMLKQHNFEKKNIWKVVFHET